jgi:hypothetical protein
MNQPFGCQNAAPGAYSLSQCIKSIALQIFLWSLLSASSKNLNQLSNFSFVSQAVP